MMTPIAPSSRATSTPWEEQLRPVTIARNYAEALFQLGEQSGHTALYADLLDAVAHASRLDAAGLSGL